MIVSVHTYWVREDSQDDDENTTGQLLREVYVNHNNRSTIEYHTHPSTLAPPRNSKKKGHNGTALPHLLLWFDPPSDGGDPITKYRITYSKMPAYAPTVTKIFNVFEVRVLR